MLGSLVTRPLDFVLAGGSALLLGGHLARTTNDADVIACDPPFDDTLRATIATVGQELGIASTWLNDGAAAFAHFLAPDYRARCRPHGTFGKVSVVLLDRPDLILLKLMALRTADMDDLDLLAPTADELVFARSQFVRIAAIDPRRVQRARIYLEGVGVRPSEHRPSDVAPSRRHTPRGGAHG